jgi:hypothetical protein
VFCVDFFLILSTSFRSAAVARRKGHSGLGFGLLHAGVVFAAEISGLATGLLVGFKVDPFMDKNSATGPILMGAAGGLGFGVLLMFLVVGLLPTTADAPRPRPRRTLGSPSPDS